MDVTAHHEIRSLGLKMCIVDWKTVPKALSFVVSRSGSVFFRRRPAILPWRKGMTVWSKVAGYAPGEIVQAIREDILAHVEPDELYFPLRSPNAPPLPR